MAQIWSEEAKFQTLLEVEIAASEAQCELGNVPKEALEQIKKNARFDVARIKEIEEEVKHDIIAFLTNVGENVGEASRFVHLGMTSSDAIDTALALQLKRASKIIEKDLQDLHDAILEKARQHKYTVGVGRSHGIHAEPLTFGFKLCVWLEEVRRHQIRFRHAVEGISVGKISGAVGTFSNISPEVERIACEQLGLKPDPISTQIVQRDRHAEFMFTLALIGSSLDKFATEIRHLQRTDVLEAEEPFEVGQKVRQQCLINVIQSEVKTYPVWLAYYGAMHWRLWRTFLYGMSVISATVLSSELFSRTPPSSLTTCWLGLQR